MDKKQKCIVKGCVNLKDGGRFEGDLCFPCHDGLSKGRYGPSTCFVRKLQIESDEYDRLKIDFAELQDQYSRLEKDYEQLERENDELYNKVQSKIDKRAE